MAWRRERPKGVPFNMVRDVFAVSINNFFRLLPNLINASELYSYRNGGGESGERKDKLAKATQLASEHVSA